MSKNRLKRFLSPTGFTLMELLVAMVITVLLVAALFNVFDLAGRAWQKGEARTQRYQNLRQALDRMSDDIRSAILLSIGNNPGKEDGIKFYGENDFNSEGDRLSFIPVSHPPDGWDYGSDYGVSPPELCFDCCEIGYNVTGTTLYRRKQEKSVPDGEVTNGGRSDPLAEHITRLDFTYYEADGTEHNTWDSSPAGASYCQDKLPTRVRIELTAQADLAREQKEETFTTEVWLGQANFQ